MPWPAVVPAVGTAVAKGVGSWIASEIGQSLLEHVRGTKYEEQLRNVQKKIQVIFMIFCIMIIVNISIIMIVITAGHGEPV